MLQRRVGSPRGRTRRSAVVAAVATATVAMFGLSGCGTGFDAQTNAVYDQGAGTNARGGPVDVLNALIVDNGNGTGTFSATLTAEAGTSDRLIGVTAQPLGDVDPSHKIPVTVISGGVPVDPEAPLAAQYPPRLGSTGAVTVQLDGGQEPVTAGQVVDLTFSFQVAAQIELQVPVVARTPMYDSVVQAPATTTPTAS